MADKCRLKLAKLASNGTNNMSLSPGESLGQAGGMFQVQLNYIYPLLFDTGSSHSTLEGTKLKSLILLRYSWHLTLILESSFPNLVPLFFRGHFLINKWRQQQRQTVRRATQKPIRMTIVAPKCHIWPSWVRHCGCTHLLLSSITNHLNGFEWLCLVADLQTVATSVLPLELPGQDDDDDDE